MLSYLKKHHILFNMMAIQPNCVVGEGLIRACRLHKDTEISERIMYTLWWRRVGFLWYGWLRVSIYNVDALVNRLDDIESKIHSYPIKFVVFLSNASAKPIMIIWQNTTLSIIKIHTMFLSFVFLLKLCIKYYIPVKRFLGPNPLKFSLKNSSYRSSLFHFSNLSVICNSYTRVYFYHRHYPTFAVYDKHSFMQHSTWAWCRMKENFGYASKVQLFLTRKRWYIEPENCTKSSILQFQSLISKLQQDNR